MKENETNDAHNENAEEHSFTCKDCGGHNLNVRAYGRAKMTVSETQDCDCGYGDGGLSFERTYDLHTPFEELYMLDEEGHFNKKLDEDIDSSEKDDEETNIYCHDCYDPEEELTYDEGDPNSHKKEYEEYFVECADCQREIEFGWSHSNRGGRIWPAERKDFSPWRCWPEPRYIEEWRKKNWLNPNSPYLQ